MSYVDDRYKDNPTVSDRYYTSNFKEVTSAMPTNGETIGLFTKRLARRIRETEETASTHLKWHTHQSAGACWICDLCQDLNTIYDVLQQITDEFKDVNRRKFPINKNTKSYDF